MKRKSDLEFREKSDCFSEFHPRSHFIDTPNPFRKTFNDERKDVQKAREERTRLEELSSRGS